MDFGGQIPPLLGIGGCPALYQRISGTAGNIRIVYHRASVESEDSFYQIITWTLASRDAEATPRLLEAIHSFIAKTGAPVPADTGVTGSRLIVITVAQLEIGSHLFENHELVGRIS